MSARILVVDDSASMRQMVSFALTSAGFAVEEAEDGAVALGRAKGQRFNAVVTDVNMPNMDGISLIRELRQLPDYKFTPMLMLTTESAADKKSEGKAAGATGLAGQAVQPRTADRHRAESSRLNPPRFSFGFHAHEHGPATFPRHLFRGKP